MQATAFCAGIRAIHTSLPYAKKMNDDDLMFLWMTLDDNVKRDVTDAMWVYACKQLLETWSPDHPVNQPVHIQAFKFLYRCMNEVPCFDWGMKQEVCTQFNLPDGYGKTQLPPQRESIAAGWGGQGLLDSERSGSTDNFLDF